MDGGKKQGIIEIKKSDSETEITKRKGHLIVVSQVHQTTDLLMPF